VNRLAVLISGRGSNLLAIAAAIEQRELDAKIVHVVASKPGTSGAAAARERGWWISELDPKAHATREEYDAALLATIAAVPTDWIVLAGYMRILTSATIDAWRGRIVNIHPSLLPKYPGLHPHAQALAAGDKEHGATVHFVTPELDAGPAIAQARVPIEPTDDEATLAARVLRIEHRLYPFAIQLLVNRRLVWSEPHPLLDGQPLQAPLELPS
jgi:phosphoribosylglycinamide formyltransferase 1